MTGEAGVIVGGGIGGLCTAVALRQAGVEVRVYEAAAAAGAVGAGIWVAPNAMEALDRLGLAEAVAARGSAIAQVRLFDRRGTVLSTVQGSYLRERFGHTITSIHRAELHKVLLACLEEDIVVFGKRCQSFHENDAGVHVSFDDGTTVAGLFLIGADGLESTVRKQLFPTSRLRYSGETCWRGVAQTQLTGDLHGGTAECWGRGRRFGFSQIGQGAVYWWATQTTAVGGSDDRSTVKTQLSHRFRDFMSPIPELLEATPPDSIIRHDLCDLAPLTSWGTGRVALLGDAAHAPTPNLGQGGAQAIEDAWVLGQSFEATDDYALALRRYERVRKAKATRVTQESWRYGKLASTANPVLCAVRNLLIRMTPTAVSRRYLGWLFRLEG